MSTSLRLLSIAFLGFVGGSSLMLTDYLEGKIEAAKIGGRYRFTKSLLDRWLGKKTSGVGDVSGRNKLVGRVTAIKQDAILAQVDVDIGSHKITAVITRDALDELGLRIGDTAIALVKATEVMIVKD